MLGRAALLVSLSVVACAKAERAVSGSVPAEGIVELEATVARGDLEITGEEGSDFELSGRVIGYGGSRGQAEHRADGVGVSFAAEGAKAVLETSSEFRRSWADLEVTGPAVVDLDVWVERGSLHVDGVAGRHLLTADRITTRALAGTVDLLATAGGMDVDVRPDPTGEVLLESAAGDVILRLPYGAPYDVEVIGDPAWDMIIADLGFHTEYEEAGYFAGTVGDGSIRVVVYLNGGSFQLAESL